MSEEPTLSGLGVTVTVRLAPVPPSTTPVSGITSGLEVSRVITSSARGVSVSAMVKDSEPVVLSSMMVLSGISRMVGGSLTETKVTCTESTSCCMPPVPVLP